MRGRRSTDLDVRDTEGEEGRSDGTDRRALRDRRERLAENDQGYESAAEGPQSGKPWGFFLVLAAVVVVAVMYLATMFSIPNIPPATAIGAMSGALALIGTLVGTYFGIKAGLDGQDKVKETVSRAIRGSEGRQRVRIRRED
jgi:hypothetical protein